MTSPFWVDEKKYQGIKKVHGMFSGFIESCFNIFSNKAMSFLLRYCHTGGF
jgi:hypothetical protein